MKPYRRQLSGEDAGTGTIAVAKAVFAARMRASKPPEGAVAEIKIRDGGVRSTRHG